MKIGQIFLISSISEQFGNSSRINFFRVQSNKNYRRLRLSLGAYALAFRSLVFFTDLTLLAALFSANFYCAKMKLLPKCSGNHAEQFICVQETLLSVKISIKARIWVALTSRNNSLRTDDARATRFQYFRSVYNSTIP